MDPPGGLHCINQVGKNSKPQTPVCGGAAGFSVHSWGITTTDTTRAAAGTKQAAGKVGAIKPGITAMIAGVMALTPDETQIFGPVDTVERAAARK